jgi:DNA gyrase subunit B
LEQLAREYLAVRAVVDRLGHRYDETLLDALSELPTLDADMMADRAQCEAWLKRLAERVNRMEPGAVFSFDLEFGAEPGDFRANVSKRLHGVYKNFELSAGFFGSGDYKRLAGFARTTEGLFGPDTHIAADDKKERVRSFKQAFEWMMGEAKRGQHIQRYKGLGEMNPEQLFETTLDSNTRRLLQVKIEDAIAADEIFTTLMGDQVEPRRDFIEKNALDVANLDI